MAVATAAATSLFAIEVCTKEGMTFRRIHEVVVRAPGVFALTAGMALLLPAVCVLISRDGGSPEPRGLTAEAPADKAPLLGEVPPTGPRRETQEYSARPSRPEQVAVALESGPDRSLPPEAGCSVWGVLRDSSGAPIVKPSGLRSVVLTDTEGSVFAAPFHGEDGYCLERLPAGRYRVEAWAQGYERQSVDVVAPCSQPLDITLDDRESIAVLVQDALGRPLRELLKDVSPTEAAMISGSLGVAVEGAAILEGRTVSEQSSAPRFVRDPSSGQADRLGWIEGLKPRLAPLALDLLLGTATIDTQALFPGDAEVRFQVDALDGLIPLTIAVVDANSGAPVSAGMLIVQVKDSGRMIVLSEGEPPSVLVPPGEVALTYLPGDHETTAVNHIVPAGVTEDSLAIEVGRIVGVSGVIRSSVPVDLEEANILVYKKGAGDLFQQVGLPNQTDAGGAFDILVGPGSYLLRVEPVPGGPNIVSDYVPVAIGHTPVRDLLVEADRPAFVAISNRSAQSACTFVVRRHGLAVMAEQIGRAHV